MNVKTKRRIRRLIEEIDRAEGISVLAGHGDGRLISHNAGWVEVELPGNSRPRQDLRFIAEFSPRRIQKSAQTHRKMVESITESGESTDLLLSALEAFYGVSEDEDSTLSEVDEDSDYEDGDAFLFRGVEFHLVTEKDEDGEVSYFQVQTTDDDFVVEEDWSGPVHGSEIVRLMEVDEDE